MHEEKDREYIDDIFGDTSVEAEQTANRLADLADLIEGSLSALRDDGATNLRVNVAGRF